MGLIKENPKISFVLTLLNPALIRPLMSPYKPATGDHQTHHKGQIPRKLGTNL
jgi:hypothetical protein